MKIKRLGVLCAMLSVLLLVLAGCQVSGVDMTKALVAGTNVKSSEGSASFTLELLGNGKPNSDNTAVLKYIETLKKVTITLKEIKSESPELLSAKGEIALATGTAIPLNLTFAKDKLTVLFDGASKPYVFNLQSAVPADLLPFGLTLDSLGSSLSDIIAKIIPFIAPNLPNPSVINVEKATETINNEAVSLNKVRIEVKGDELAGLIKQLIGNILEDEEGLRELVKTVMSQNGAAQGSFDLSGIAVGFIKSMLQDLETTIDQKLADTGVVNDKLSLKSDLFLDSDLNQRKANFELAMSLPDMEKDGFTGLKVTGTMSKWNLNQPVKADVIDVSKGALEQTDKTKMAHFIKTLDKKSQLYGLLVNDMQVLKREIVLQMSADGKHVPETLSPFLKEGNTMGPVRFVTEKLDADVEWNNDTREVTITDIMTGKKVVLAIGSRTVLVDGQTLSESDGPEVAPEIIEGSTFVPIAWLARLFDATTVWNNDTRQVTINKN